MNNNLNQSNKKLLSEILRISTLNEEYTKEIEIMQSEYEDFK